MDQINYGYCFSPVDLQIQCNLSQNWAASSVETDRLILKLIEWSRIWNSQNIFEEEQNSVKESRFLKDVSVKKRQSFQMQVKQLDNHMQKKKRESFDLYKN